MPINKGGIDQIKHVGRFYVAPVVLSALASFAIVEPVRPKGDAAPKLDCKKQVAEQLAEIQARRADGAWLTTWVRKPHRSDVIVTRKGDDHDIMRNPLVLRCEGEDRYAAVAPTGDESTDLTMTVKAADVALRGVSTLRKVKVRFSQIGEQYGFEDAKGNEYGILGDQLRIDVFPQPEPQAPTLSPYRPTFLA